MSGRRPRGRGSRPAGAGFFSPGRAARPGPRARFLRRAQCRHRCAGRRAHASPRPGSTSRAARSRRPARRRPCRRGSPWAGCRGSGASCAARPRVGSAGRRVATIEREVSIASTTVASSSSTESLRVRAGKPGCERCERDQGQRGRRRGAAGRAAADEIRDESRVREGCGLAVAPPLEEDVAADGERDQRAV